MGNIEWEADEEQEKWLKEQCLKYGIPEEETIKKIIDLAKTADLDFYELLDVILKKAGLDNSKMH